jgi:hypothetical protein
MIRTYPVPPKRNSLEQAELLLKPLRLKDLLPFEYWKNFLNPVCAVLEIGT